MPMHLYMIEAGKFNVAPCPLFSGSEGKAIPGSLCRNPATLLQRVAPGSAPLGDGRRRGSGEGKGGGKPDPDCRRGNGERQQGRLAARRKERAKDSCNPNVIWLGKATCQLQLLWREGVWVGSQGGGAGATF